MAHQPDLTPDATSPRAASPYPFKWTRRVVVLLACLFLSVLAGGVTGVVVSRIDSAGYFVRWQRLPNPPAVATSLALSVARPDRGFVTLHARLASGKSVALTPPEAVWQTSALPSENVASPCAPSLPALARTTNPPNGLTGCVYHYGRGADCDQRLAVALHGDGHVWQWSNGRCALGMIGVALITFVASGLVYLLLFSFLGLVWLRRREGGEVTSG